MSRRKVIFVPSGEWMVIGGQWWEPSCFDTWAEAMAYADKRARTIEVTLPRLGDDAIQILSREGLIPYNPAYAEEIAQAMLAINHLWR